MRERYLDEIRKAFLALENHELFLTLLTYIAIKDLKRIPVFTTIKERAVVKLSAQEIFDKMALPLARQNNVAAIQFLIEECNFNLCQITDVNQYTLLHEACLYGSEQVVAYLLKQGSNPNAKSVTGTTPLHYAVELKGNIALISLLRQYKANLNARDNANLAPLHIAVLRDNPEGIIALNKAGANMRLQVDGMSYIQLKAAKNKGDITISNQSELQVINEEKKNEAQYLQGIFNPKFNEQIFRKTMDSLLNRKEELSLEDSKKLIDCYFLINFSARLNKLKAFLDEHLRSGRLTLHSACTSMLRPTKMLPKQQYAGWIEQLLDLGDLFASQQNSPSIDMAELFNFIASVYLDLGKYQKSIDAATKGLALVVDVNQLVTAHLLYNRGISKKNQLLLLDALADLKEAYRLASNDEDIFQAYFTTLLRLGLFNEASQLANASDYGELSAIYRIYTSYLRGNITNEALIKKMPTDFQTLNAQILSFDLQANYYAKLGNYERSLSLSECSFNLSEQRMQKDSIDIGYSIAQRLKIYISCGKYEEALSFLLSCQDKYSIEFSSNIVLKGFAAMIFAANNNTEQFMMLIEELKTNNSSILLLTQLYLYFAVSIINTGGNVESALPFLDMTLEIDANNSLAKTYKLLIFILTKNEEKLSQIHSVLDLDTNINLLKKEYPAEASSVSKDSDSGLNLPEELSCEDYDPVKVHEFFQAQKRQLLDNLNQQLCPAPQPEIQWALGRKVFYKSTEGLASLDSLFYPNYYAVIDPDLNLEKSVRERFQMALNNGLCKKRCGENGIKILKNAVVELKIDDNIRLYTKLIYKNHQGNLLIVFDQKGNHEVIRRILQEKEPLKIIQLLEPENECKISGFNGSLFNNISVMRKENITEEILSVATL